jgi:hypothetical protein
MSMTTSNSSSRAQGRASTRGILATYFAAACGLSLLSLPVAAQAPAPKAPAAAPAPAAPAPAPAAAPPPPAAPPPAAPPPPPPAPVAPPPAAPPPGAVPPPPPPPQYTTAPASQPGYGWGTPPEPDTSAERPQILAGYEISLPVGDLRDFATAPSYRGFEAGALWPIWRSLYIGPVFNYHLFYEHKGETTYLIDNGAITADLYRYARTWTMGAALRYLFLEPKGFARPYVGLRLGITFATMATLVTDLSLYDNPVGFALAPEGGVMLRLTDFMHFAAAVRYDYSTAGTASWDNISYVAYHMGFVFQNRQ